MMDDKLTNRIQDWLDTPAPERDVPAGAAMLLSLNRNRVLFQNIMRRPDKMAAKLEYELKKHLRIRLDGLTLKEVVRMDAVVMPAAKESLENFGGMDDPEVLPEEGEAPQAVHVGRRANHEALPARIRALYDGQTGLYHRIKELYNTLVHLKDAPACDRYEHLKILKEVDDTFRKNWQAYDAAEPLKEGEEDASEENGEEPEPGEDVPPTAKDVAAARKYISSNLKVIESLEGEKRTNLLAAVQERVELVIRSGGSFKPDFRDKLISIGVIL